MKLIEIKVKLPLIYLIYSYSNNPLKVLVLTLNRKYSFILSY